MSDQELEPMSPQMRQLLAAEAARSTLSAEAVKRVTARIDDSFSAAGPLEVGSETAPKGATAAGVGLGKAKLLAVFVAGALVGVVADRAIDGRSPAPAVSPPPAAQTEVKPEPSPATVPAAAQPAPAPQVPSKAPAAPRVSPKENVRDQTLADERALLELARTALSRGKYTDADAALEQHERTYPAGTLAEEREVLAIQALWLEGKPDLARERGERFRLRYPDSVLLPSIEPMPAP